MKTAHDSLELFDLRKLTNYTEWIKAIQAVQLDAYKAGMAEAAEIAATEFLRRSAATTNIPSVPPTAMQVNQAIISARDNKTIL